MYQLSSLYKLKQNKTPALTGVNYNAYAWKRLTCFIQTFRGDG